MKIILWQQVIPVELYNTLNDKNDTENRAVEMHTSPWNLNINVITKKPLKTRKRNYEEVSYGQINRMIGRLNISAANLKAQGKHLLLYNEA